MNEDVVITPVVFDLYFVPMGMRLGKVFKLMFFRKPQFAKTFVLHLAFQSFHMRKEICLLIETFLVSHLMQISQDQISQRFQNPNIYVIKGHVKKGRGFYWYSFGTKICKNLIA